MSDWVKILITAVVSSVATAIIAEPLKGYLSRRLALRRLRPALYRELAFVSDDIDGAADYVKSKQRTVLCTIDNGHYEDIRKDEQFYALNEAASFNSLYFRVKEKLADVQAAQRQQQPAEQLNLLTSIQLLIEAYTSNKPFSTRYFKECKAHATKQKRFIHKLIKLE
jgi:hypothetical protein